MTVFRIASANYIADLSGNGSKLYGGRWNEKGVAMVYFASSRAMAIMELLVHLMPEDLYKDYAIAEFKVPDDKILKISLTELPDNWKDEEREVYLKKIGKKFIDDGRYLLMQIPSILVEEENNFIMNPSHTDAQKVKLISQRIFKFDRRLKN